MTVIHLLIFLIKTQWVHKSAAYAVPTCKHSIIIAFANNLTTRKKRSREPELNQRPKDTRTDSTVLRSTS